MRKNTDLDAVKSVARSFLYLDIRQNTQFPFLVSHPFFSNQVIAVRHNGENRILNIMKAEELELARSVITESINAVDKYQRFLTLICAPYLPAFFKHTNMHLSLEDFSAFLGALWTYVECPNSDPTVSVCDFVRYFRKADKSMLMDPEEYALYCQLPEQLTVYRGVKPQGKINALSWTRNKESAQWFANRFEHDGKVYSAIVNKADVLAYYNCRNEEEIVLDYRKLIDVKMED